MKREADEDLTAKRLPYEKPTVHRVELRPEEAVLGSCKTHTGAGPISDSCTVPVGCSSAGS